MSTKISISSLITALVVVCSASICQAKVNRGLHTDSASGERSYEVYYVTPQYRSAALKSVNDAVSKKIKKTKNLLKEKALRPNEIKYVQQASWDQSNGFSVIIVPIYSGMRGLGHGYSSIYRLQEDDLLGASIVDKDYQPACQALSSKYITNDLETAEYLSRVYSENSFVDSTTVSVIGKKILIQEYDPNCIRKYKKPKLVIENKNKKSSKSTIKEKLMKSIEL